MQSISSYLKAVRVLVTRPNTSLRVEKKTLLVLLADVVVKILGNGELTMKLCSVKGMSVILLRSGELGPFFTCSKDTP
jgi:hypothetical protein